MSSHNVSLSKHELTNLDVKFKVVPDALSLAVERTLELRDGGSCARGLVMVPQERTEVAASGFSDLDAAATRRDRARPSFTPRGAGDDSESQALLGLATLEHTVLHYSQQ